MESDETFHSVYPMHYKHGLEYSDETPAREADLKLGREASIAAIKSECSEAEQKVLLSL